MRNVGAEQPDLARRRPQVATDLIEQGSLAGPIWTNDQAAFARSYGERHILRYDKTTEGLVQVHDLECMVGGRLDHDDPLRNPAISLLKPGTIPVGITRTMNRNTRPSSMFHRSM